jgi:hypothetical protein
MCVCCELDTERLVSPAVMLANKLSRRLIVVSAQAEERAETCDGAFNW